ncbi:hypothetical protein [Archaeoglobus profundus]|uniref:Uncharacterized protein n=1 Tax=Archaeoglobus profundus (strain DSM 5631 / JCM 9629 / NBRC 100127 / Av18) TaxID=572546 RepID=D2RFA7_ARCPA|nr:hypothetical protein [Archaeoglobus profundus]ADB58801.1 hypothetical protein Arcpr_1757 [Archaeoglobus profundus DSM 5631]
MSTLDLSKIRQLAHERGITDEYYEYLRFSDFKDGFDGFISRIIQDLEEVGITISENDIIDKILPTSKLVVKTLYEGGFINEITKNAKEKVRGDFIAIIVEKISIVLIVYYLFSLTGLIKQYAEHKLNMIKLKDYKEFFKEELNMDEKQIKELLIKIVESIEKKGSSGPNLSDFSSFIKYLMK